MTFTPDSREESVAPLTVRANAPARIGPTIVERKPFGPGVPEGVRLRPAIPGAPASVWASGSGWSAESVSPPDVASGPGSAPAARR